MVERAVRDQLERLIRSSGEGYAEMSRRLGRNPAYIQQFIKRGVPRRLSEQDRRILAEHFGVCESLLGGAEPGPASLSPASTQHGITGIPYLQTAQHPAQQGAPNLMIDGALVSRLPLPRKRQLAAHVVEGDSMAPTLLAGDHVLIDTTETAHPSDGLYVIESDGLPLIKRLSVHPVTHRIAILSDNAAYPSFPDCDAAGIHILGRVVWVGRALP